MPIQSCPNMVSSTNVFTNLLLLNMLLNVKLIPERSNVKIRHSFLKRRKVKATRTRKGKSNISRIRKERRGGPGCMMLPSSSQRPRKPSARYLESTPPSCEHRGSTEALAQILEQAPGMAFGVVAAVADEDRAHAADCAQAPRARVPLSSAVRRSD